MLSQQLADYAGLHPQPWAACHLLVQPTSLPSEPCWPSDCSLLYFLTPALSSEMLKPSWSPTTIFLENWFCKWYLSWYILHIVIDSMCVNVYIYICQIYICVCIYILVHDKYLCCLSISKLNLSLSSTALWPPASHQTLPCTALRFSSSADHEAHQGRSSLVLLSCGKGLCVQ